MWLFNLLEETTSTSTTETTKGNSLSTIIVMIVLIVAIAGLFIWQSISNKKRQKKAQETVNALKKGDKVKTIGGVCGYVVEINDAENTFVLETGTNNKKSYVKFDKGAIYQTGSVAQKEEKAEDKAEETVEAVAETETVEAVAETETVETEKAENKD